MIAEYTEKADPDTGLKLVRYGGRWVPMIYCWHGRNDEIAEVATADGGTVMLPHNGRWLTLPNGKRTSRWYH